MVKSALWLSPFLSSSAKSGQYWIKTETPAKKNLIYCHMEKITRCFGEGGWSLAIKMDGKKVREYKNLFRMDQIFKLVSII